MFTLFHSCNHLDEGVRNVCIYLEKELSKQHITIKIRHQDVFKNLWLIKRYKPDIIHIIVGPSTIFSFIISEMLSKFFKDVKIIMSAPHRSSISQENDIIFNS